jgi:hypothetical protein
VNGSVLNRGCAPFIAAAIGLTLLGAPPAFADNAVKLKVLVLTTGDVTQDLGLAYIKPVIDEMGVPYDVLNAGTQDLTATRLSANGCAAATAGCVGNYNGTILTNSDLGGNFTPSEWGILHDYETKFHVREAVLSGWPGWYGTYRDATYPNTNNVYLDYGLITTAAYSNGDPNASPPIPSTVHFNAT